MAHDIRYTLVMVAAVAAIPFCAYNVLYRDGHVPLPNLNYD